MKYSTKKQLHYTKQKTTEQRDSCNDQLHELMKDKLQDNIWAPGDTPGDTIFN